MKNLQTKCASVEEKYPLDSEGREQSIEIPWVRCYWASQPFFGWGVAYRRTGLNSLACFGNIIMVYGLNSLACFGNIIMVYRLDI